MLNIFLIKLYLIGRAFVLHKYSRNKPVERQVYCLLCNEFEPIDFIHLKMYCEENVT